MRGMIVFLLLASLLSCQKELSVMSVGTSYAPGWHYDEILRDTVYIPFEHEFESLVDQHLNLITGDDVPAFFYNVYLDTVYSGYGNANFHKSLRREVISQIKNRNLLKNALKDSEFQRVWASEKKRKPELVSNIEIVEDQLRILAYIEKSIK